jgi:hypothetical protein
LPNTHLIVSLQLLRTIFGCEQLVREICQPNASVLVHFHSFFVGADKLSHLFYGFGSLFRTGDDARFESILTKPRKKKRAGKKITRCKTV